MKSIFNSNDFYLHVLICIYLFFERTKIFIFIEKFPKKNKCKKIRKKGIQVFL